MLLKVDLDLIKTLNISSGTVQWIAKSSLRPTHKRKNWFIDLTLFTPPKESDLDLSEIRIDTMRAGGPGGQHQNKTESAVQITHIPTNIVVISRSERSQMMNRKLALAQLLEQLKQIEENETAQQGSDRWACHHQLKRGEPILVFKGSRFELV